MTSTLTWLVFSAQQCRQVVDGAQDSRDDLGIGTVGDALADLLFPGTSTIQDQVRHFLFIPGSIGVLNILASDR